MSDLGLGQNPPLRPTEFRKESAAILSILTTTFVPTPEIARLAGMPVGRVSRILAGFGSCGPVEKRYQLRANSSTQFLTLWRKR